MVKMILDLLTFSIRLAFICAVVWCTFAFLEFLRKELAKELVFRKIRKQREKDRKRNLPSSWPHE